MTERRVSNSATLAARLLSLSVLLPGGKVRGPALGLVSVELRSGVEKRDETGR